MKSETHQHLIFCLAKGVFKIDEEKSQNFKNSISAMTEPNYSFNVCI